MTHSKPENLRLIWWGTYDLGKPRTRILLRGLRELGVEVVECRADIWGGIEDKSTVTSWGSRLRLLGRWLVSYPVLLWRYLGLPPHDAVIVGYPGQLDVLLIRPLAWLRGVPVVLDLMQSLYATVVIIRRMVGPRHPVAALLYALEWLAFRAADRVVFVSRYAAFDYAKRFGLSADKTAGVLIGGEPEYFPPRPVRSIEQADTPFTVLFYGTFHKLHGVDTIVAAARLGRDLPIHWVLIGDGQEAAAVRASLAQDPLDKLSWISWLPYDKLIEQLHNADVGLGLIGRPDHAGWAIPNKTMQILMSGTPLISVDSPAVRELLSPESPGVALIPPGNPQALLDAVQTMWAQRRELRRQPLHRAIAKRLMPNVLAAEFLDIVTEARHKRRGTAMRKADMTK